MNRRPIIPVFAAALLLAASSAQASTFEECAERAKSAQSGRREGHLLEAREAAVKCASDESCPGIMRADCQTWLAELERRIPSVIVHVLREDGTEAVDAEVNIDGKPQSRARAGLALPMNPGEHRFAARLLDRDVETVIVVGEGEQQRAVQLRLPTAKRPELARRETPPPSPSPASRVPLGSWISAGVALAGFGTFGVLAAHGQVAYGPCDPTCRGGSADAFETQKVATFTAFGVGAIALGVAALVYLLRPGS